MFCAWSLYVKPHPTAAYQCLDIDDVTEISYDWKSPYFFSELSATWDFSLPRTPVNEQLLIPKTNADGELLPFTDGVVPAYFIGLPWQEDEEIDAGELSIVKLSELRITVQFRQINTLFQKLVKLDGSALRIQCESTYQETPPRAFLALGETMKANGSDLTHWNDGCLAIRIEYLIEQILETVGGQKIVSNIDPIKQLNLYLLYEKNLIQSRSFTPSKKTRYQTNEKAGSGFLNHELTFSYNEASSSYERFEIMFLDGKGDTSLPLKEDLYSFLQKLLQLLGLTLQIREKRSAYTYKLHSIHDTLREGLILGELTTYQWFPFKIQNYIPYNEPVQTAIPLEQVIKNVDNKDTPWEELTYNAPFPNILYMKNKPDLNVEGNRYESPIRFFDRKHPICFIAPVNQGSPLIDNKPSGGDIKSVERFKNVLFSKNDDGYETEHYYYQESEKKFSGELIYTFNTHIPKHPVLSHKSYYDSYDVNYNLYINLFGHQYITRDNKWHYHGFLFPTTSLKIWRTGIQLIESPFKSARLVLLKVSPNHPSTMRYDMAYQYTRVYDIYGHIKHGVDQHIYASFWNKKYDYRTISPFRWLLKDYKTYEDNIEKTLPGGVRFGRYIPDYSGGTTIPTAYSPSVLYDRYGNEIKRIPKPWKPPIIPNPEKPEIPDLGDHGEIYEDIERGEIKPLNFKYLFYGSGSHQIYPAPPIPALNIRASSEIKDEPYFYIAQAKRLAFVADNPWLPHLTVHDSVRYWALVGDANVALEPIRQAYYNQFQRAILGELRTWDEQQIFDNLYTPPYEPLDDPIRIGRQRVYSVKIKITRNEVRITGVTVVQYNK